MENESQYGHPLYLEGFQPESSAKKLTRLHLSKGSEGVVYNEAWLQRLIMSHPSLLPIDQIDDRAFTNLTPICVELPTQSGYLDNLLVTPTGNIALIECKLWRNPEARREVVGQILEYAKDMSTWSYERLEEAINGTRCLDGSSEKVRRLYEMVSAKGVIDEAAFHDAVSRNLKLGRFLLLIVGDGIREGMESLTGFLQQHAGFHFRLAIVDLALFELPTGGYIAQPRVIAKTTNIERGIVKLDEGRITIGPSPTQTITGISPRRTSITQEQYFELLEKNLPGISPALDAFIDDLKNYNVSPDFGTDSMILRWRPDSPISWNLGTIVSSGQLWMDYMGQQAKNAGLGDSHKRYLESLAKLVPGATIKKTPQETAWNVGTQDGKIVRIDSLLADQTRKEGWLRAITDFQADVMKTSENN